MITSDEKVKTLVESAVENVTKCKEHSEEVLQQKIKNLVAAADELDKEKKQLQELIEDHNRGCVGLFHKKIKL
jgi:DNA-binding transcriptional regulator YhcF (GntR family)